MDSTPRLASATTASRQTLSQAELHDASLHTLALPVPLVLWTEFGAQRIAPQLMTVHHVLLAALVPELLLVPNAYSLGRPPTVIRQRVKHAAQVLNRQQIDHAAMLASGQRIQRSVSNAYHAKPQ